MGDRSGGEVGLFLRRARELLKRPAVTCERSLSAREIGRLLGREHVGAVVVQDGAGPAIGIVTDRDLRRVVTERRDPSTTTAAELMSWPLVSVAPEAFAFQAALEMTRRHIHHVVVIEDRRAIGVLSSWDFLFFPTTHPVALAREIDAATSLDDLAELAPRVTGLVRQLVNRGESTYQIGQIVSELNDRLVIRVLYFVAKRVGEAGEDPPVSYCWLAIGSEGRREQTLRTDQDNCLVYEDPPRHLAVAAAKYFAGFTEEATRALVAVGFPPCDGGFMASNPRWCQPLSVWRRYFLSWIRQPSPEKVLPACIFFDLLPVAGAKPLAHALRGIIDTEAPRNSAFVALLAKDVVWRRPPLTVFGNVKVQRRGVHRGRVEVKAAGSLQLVGAARLYAIQLALGVTNTVERFQAVGARGLYSESDITAMVQAHQHLTRLRLIHELGRLERGETPDKWIDPRQLSRADALLFLDALRIVERVQAGIRGRFATDFIPIDR
jgi:CBS domain-containing protein